MSKSLKPLQDLLKRSGPTSTLNVWSSAGDVVDVKNLAKVLNEIGLNRIYLDVPNELERELRPLLKE